MTNDIKRDKLRQLDEKIILIENSLKSLNEELARLKYKRQRLEEKYNIKSTEDLACTNHEPAIQENPDQSTISSEQNVSGVKKKERKKWADNHYVIEVNDREIKKRKLAGSDQPYAFEEHFPNVHLNKIKPPPPRIRTSDISFYSTPPSSASRIKQYQGFWPLDKIKLKQDAKAGLLKLNFKGANIAKIPGYGERVHFD